MKWCFALIFGFVASSGMAENVRPVWGEFAGENALKHVQALVDCGPRPPATEAIEKARRYITKQLEEFGWKVTPQPFTNSTPQGEIKFANLIATFGEKAQPSFILCSHYDTKFFPTATFVGANDGGSSNGILLEMA